MTEQMPREIERKYLIRRPDAAVIASLPGVQSTEITQTYLRMQEEGFGRRVRKRGTLESGWEYTYTRKKQIGFGERIELEDTVSEEAYLMLLQEAEPSMQPIRKVRHVFNYLGQVFELDVYACSAELATLEIELPDIRTPVTLPPEIAVIEDVTGKPGYSNFALARQGGFPAGEPPRASLCFGGQGLK